MLNNWGKLASISKLTSPVHAVHMGPATELSRNIGKCMLSWTAAVCCYCCTEVQAKVAVVGSSQKPGGRFSASKPQHKWTAVQWKGCARKGRGWREFNSLQMWHTTRIALLLQTQPRQSELCQVSSLFDHPTMLQFGMSPNIFSYMCDHTKSCNPWAHESERKPEHCTRASWRTGQQGPPGATEMHQQVVQQLWWSCL